MKKITKKVITVIKQYVQMRSEYAAVLYKYTNFVWVYTNLATTNSCRQHKALTWLHSKC